MSLDATPGRAAPSGGAITGPIRRLLRGAVIAGGIKIAGFGGAFLMTLSLARAMTPEAYGVFAVAFSLATILGFVATVGQHTAILRFWPALDEAHGPGTAGHAVARGLTLSALGAVGVLGLSLAAGLAAPVVPAFGTSPWIYPAIGLMAVAFVLSEVMVGVLRAKGAILAALGPRDIAWRAAVIGAVPWFGDLSGPAAVTLAAGGLLLMTGPQAVAAVRDALDARAWPRPSARQYAAMRHAQWGLWANATLGPVNTHAATIIVGMVLGPATAGAYFAADRLARLLSITLIGVNQVIGPMMARAWHGGRPEEARLLARASSALASSTALAGLVVYVFVGKAALTLFSPEYHSFHPVLLVLAVGQVAKATCGSAPMMLNMTGHERRVLVMLTLSGGLGILLTAVLGSEFGPIGAAVGATAAVTGWSLGTLALLFAAFRTQPRGPVTAL